MLVAPQYQRSDVHGKDSSPRPIVIIGAGPAGLTAALCLTRRGERPVVLEADTTVGGISRTVVRDGWRFDIGGHRFFTKVPEVEAFWNEVLPHDLLTRPRMSRIFYDGKFYDYPLRATNALGNLGIPTAMRCVGSYAWARVHPPRDQSTFEGWVTARFGRRLYQTFFKTYTEKVWGVPGSSLQADWAAQRIKNLSLGAAVLNALRPRRKQTNITSLIEEFQYPRLGPGMMWEACRDQALQAGAVLHQGAAVVGIDHRDGDAMAVHTADGRRHECSAVISSMPIGELIQVMDPPPPAEVLAAAGRLHHRDFLTVALVVPQDSGFPDNWIYIHSPDVRLGRVQNFGRWSEEMVKPGRTCLGLEYFVNEGDDLWSLPDDELVDFARKELATLGLIRPEDVEAGFVTRVPKAYPVYDATYQESVDAIREWLAEHAANVQPVGRNGMHRYNNQDHSMLTAMLAVENIVDGTQHDLWAVNVEDEYHEEQRPGATHEHGRSTPAPAHGTGRAAPVFS